MKEKNHKPIITRRPLLNRLSQPLMRHALVLVPDRVLKRLRRNLGHFDEIVHFIDLLLGN